MIYSEQYKKHIEYAFTDFCKIVPHTAILGENISMKYYLII